MILRHDGKPYIYEHHCNPLEEGRELTPQEIQEFAKECLINSYEMKGVDIIRHTPDFNSGADFSYCRYGKTICGKVIYAPTENAQKIVFGKMYGEIPDDDFDNLRKGCESGHTSPIVYYAKPKCISSEDGTFIAGGEYEIEYSPIEWMYEPISPTNHHISEYEMYQGYADSWVSGNTDFIRDHVGSFFYGQSDLSFEDITSKQNLIEHIKYQHIKWDKTGASISTELVRDTDSKQCGILIKFNNKPIAFVALEFSDFNISRSHTFAPSGNYEPWKGSHELYQTHGDHHAPFVDDEDLHDFIRTMLTDGELFCSVQTNVDLDGDTQNDATVMCMRYQASDDEIAYQSLSFVDRQSKQLVFLTCFPILDGTPVKVTILDIYQWDNLVEATVKCRYFNNDESFDFFFFATDYIYNKDKYQIGQEIEIGLSASCGNVQIASKGFDFEGQRAIDFLKKIGKEPTYDSAGNVEPVHFSTEKLVMFMNDDDKCPDMGQFQSPTEGFDFGEGLFYRNHYYVDTITLNATTNLKVPLYYDGCQNKDGEGITGTLWLSGRISNPGLIEGEGIKYTVVQDSCMTIAKTFLTKVINLKKRTIEDASELQSCLSSHISVDKNHRLYSIKIGNINCYHYQLFSLSPEEIVEILKLIDAEGFISEADAQTLPRLLDRVEVDDTIMSVWDAFLLDNLSSRFLPSKGCFCNEKFILSVPFAQESQKMVWGASTTNGLCPTIRPINSHLGYLTYYTWKNGCLIRNVYVINKGATKVKFFLDATYTIKPLLNVGENEKFHEIRFREGGSD